MRGSPGLFIGALGLLVGGIVVRAWAAEDTPARSESVTVNKRGGVSYLSLKDWPMKRERNVLRPVPIEEYLGMKFDQAAEQAAALTKRLEALEARLQQTDESVRALSERVQAIEARQPASAAPDADGHVVQPEPFIAQEPANRPSSSTPDQAGFGSAPAEPNRRPYTR